MGLIESRKKDKVIQKKFESENLETERDNNIEIHEKAGHSENKAGGSGLAMNYNGIFSSVATPSQIRVYSSEPGSSLLR